MSADPRRKLPNRYTDFNRVSDLAFIPSIFVLGLAALLAWRLTSQSALRDSNLESLVRASQILIIAIVAQSLHFAEEIWFGFPEDLAELTGYPPLPDWFFFAFNVGWIFVWIASIQGLRSRRAFALFASWFLALAGIANGILHPVLSGVKGAYFAGSYSAPLVGLACIFLAIRLRSLRNEAQMSSV